MSLPFRGREAVVPFVTGCHGWRTVDHWHNFNDPSRKGSKFEHMGRQIWRKDMERYSFMVGKLGNSNIYSIHFAYIAYDCATSPFMRRSICTFLGLRMMALFCSNGPPCPTASWAQVSSLKEVPMAPKTLEPLPGDWYA